MTLTEAQVEQRRGAGRARAKAFTPDYQRAAQEKRTPESKQAIAARGAAWRRRYPNRPMRRVMGWLRGWGYKFDVDAPLGRYFVDAWLYQHRVAIEIDGRYWHTNNAQVGEKREAWDRERTRYLVLAMGLCIIRVSDTAVMDGRAMSYIKARLDLLAPIDRGES
jgi:very-short-patch-repair endonuclease